MTAKVYTHQHGDILIITFPPLEGGNVQAARLFFTEEFLSLTEKYNRVIVDMSHVQNLDSSCLGPLVQRLRELQDRGGNLYLCGLHSPALREIFALTHFDKIFPITTTSEEAIVDMGSTGAQ